MNELLPYLDQLYELQKLDSAISLFKSELQKLQDEILSIQKELLAKEMELDGERKQWESLITSKKNTLSEMQSKIAKNLLMMSQYKSQLKTEKRVPVKNLLERGISKMTAENEVFAKESDTLRDEIPNLEREAQMQLRELELSLDEFKAKCKERTDSLELEEIRLTLETEELEEKRKEKSELLPAEVLSEYERLKQQTDGIAIAEATQNYCSACQTELQTQLLVELKIRKSVVLCENCGRILWLASQ